jgi:transposase-like protein
MTQDHSALLAQLDALKSADAGAVFAELIRTGLQALIEAEATEAIGAGRYERTGGRGTHRNGHRPKTVSTTAGDIEVAIPKLRSGSFFPSLLERRRRIDRALHAVIMEAYVHVVSTRSVDDLVTAMGVGSGVSKSEVSRICAGLDQEIDAFRQRSLAHTQFPYVFCDATFCKVRVGAHVVSQALVVATGVSLDGPREVLGTAVGDSESYEFWREFLASLRAGV